jgi:hypothetical protein
VANKTFWNPENRRRLDALVRKGALLVTIEKAAEILGASYAIVQSEIARQGIKATGRHTFVWTESRLQMLRSIVDAEGNLILPRANAAKLIGCDRSTLVGGLIRLRGGVESPVDPDRLKAMATPDGKLTVTRHEAARRLGCTEKRLRRAMRVAGVTGAERFSWTKEKIAQLRAMTKEGRLTAPHAEAALALECSPRALQAYLTANRIGRRIPPPRAKKVRPPSAVGILITAMRGWLPNLAPFQVKAALAAEPSLAGLSDAHLAIRLRQLSRIYHASESESLQMALSAPMLFTADLPSLRRALRDGADALDMDVKEYAKAVRRKPALTHTDVRRHFGRLPSFLGTTAEAAKRLFLRYPHLLILTPEDLRARSGALGKELHLPPAAIVTAARRQPNILRISAALQVKHCADLARMLGVDFQAVAAAYVQSPSLLQVKPETVRANVAETARLLECPTGSVTAAFLSKPPLLTLRPTFIAEKTRALAGIFDMGLGETTERVLAYPYLLTFSAESTAEKAGLLVKLSEAVEKPATPAEILMLAPHAYSYAKERIAARVEMARAGVGYRSLRAMLTMSDAQIEEIQLKRANAGASGFAH